jgi:hypothetical protein
MIYVETSRLRLRDWEEADLEPFGQFNADINKAGLSNRGPYCAN